MKPLWIQLASRAAVVLLISVPTRAQTIWYVDDDAPAGDGTSWSSPFSQLQSALEAAGPGDEIRLAGGRYTADYDPASGRHTLDRTASFQLVSGIGIYGGYAGVFEPNPDLRDPQLFETILSGDLAGDDGPDFENYGDNSYHVVTASGTDHTALLDGLTVTAGNADGDEPPLVCFGGLNSGQPCSDDDDCGDGSCVSVNSTGAGLISFAGRPTLRNCTISDNFASFQGAGMLLKTLSDLTIINCVFSGNRALDNGGAMYSGYSSPTITDCMFIGNAGKRYAGAICNRDLSNPTIINTAFVNNTAAEEESTGGGAIVNASSSPTLINCTFEGNVSFLGRAGAMYNKYGFNPALGPSEPTLKNCTFIGNSAMTGAGMYNENANPFVSDCTFDGNDAAAGEGGGAIWNDGGSPVIIGCSFTNNTGFNGGAIYSATHATPTIANCLFVGNRAINDNGGGISNVETDALITDCIFIDNSATGAGFVVGGGISNYLSSPLVSGCTFLANTADFGGGGMYNESGSGFPIVTHCVFTGNSAAYGGGMYNFTSSPVVTDSLFNGNAATGTGNSWGGAMYNDFDSSPAVTNCTIVANTADHGGGLSNENILGSPTVMSCIVWGNSPEQITDDDLTPSTVSYSNVQGGWFGEGTQNIDADPSFADPEADDYRLQPGSRCIDAGDPDLPADAGLTDLDGNPRVVDGDQNGQAVVDIGAYEVQIPCLGDIDRDGTVTDTDLSTLLGAWGPNPGHPGDLDGDGLVGVADLLTLLANWGACP